ncbi:MAG: PAS domain S-box protein [Acidobacteria bacterium]|nr:PAS domain S-box protein [Acidobacteriota bacterium]
MDQPGLYVAHLQAFIVDGQPEKAAALILAHLRQNCIENPSILFRLETSIIQFFGEIHSSRNLPISHWTEWMEAVPLQNGLRKGPDPKHSDRQLFGLAIEFGGHTLGFLLIESPDDVLVSMLPTLKPHLQLVLSHLHRQNVSGEFNLQLKNTAISSSMAGTLFTDLEGRITYANPIYLNMIGVSTLDEVLGKHAQDFTIDWQASDQIRQTILQDGYWQGEVAAKNVNGKPFYLKVTASLISLAGKPQGLVATFLDITAEYNERVLLEMERSCIEGLQRSPDFRSVLFDFCKNFDSHFPGAICSILFVQLDGKTLGNLISPGMPDGLRPYMAAFPIGPDQCSCGTAVFRKEPVIVTDLTVDPLWQGYAPLVKPYGLITSWSFPFLNAEQDVLGTFAIYYPYSRQPTPSELRLIHRIGGLLGMAIERNQAHQRLLDREMLFRAIYEQAGLGIALLDIKSWQLQRVNPAFCVLFQANEADLLGQPIAQLILPNDWDAVSENFLDRYSTQQLEIQLLRKDSSPFWGHITSTTLQGPGGTDQILIFVEDISETKAISEALLEHQAMLENAERVSQMGSWRVAVADGLTQWSDNMYALFDLDRNGEPRFDIIRQRVHPDDLQAFDAFFRLTQGKPAEGRQVEFRYGQPESWQHFISIGYWIQLEGKPYLFGTSQDVTEAMQAQQELRQTSARLQLATETAGIGIWEWDLERDQVYWDDLMYQIYELDPQPGINPDWRQKMLEEDFNANLDQLKQTIKGTSPFSAVLRISTESGIKFLQSHAIGTKNSQGRTVKLVGVAWDITPLQNALRKAEETTALLTAALEASSAGIVVIDAKTQAIRLANPMARKLWNERVNRVAQMPWRVFTPEGFPIAPEDYPLNRAVQKGERVHGVDLVLKNENGEEIWVLTNAAPVHDSNGEILAGVAVFTDISERRQTEQEAQLLHTAIDQVNDKVIITDEQGRIVYVNRAFLHFTGFRKEEILGETPRIMNSGVHSPQIFSELWKQIQSGKTWEGELVNRRRDGSLYTDAISISPLFDAAGRLHRFVAVQRDITEALENQRERESLQEQLAQSQKMEAVGRLAGGVAHDFNNILQIITGYSEMGLLELQPHQPSYEHLQEIRNAAERSASLVRQLLAFARRQTVVPRHLDLNERVTELIKMLRRLVGENIELKWQPGQDLWLVHLDPSQIDQLLANLIVNAKDAIEPPGSIILESRNEWHHSSGETEAMPWVQLSVRDTGCGMSEEILSHIFEPFFTTKEMGQGTGLGLATVYGIVEQNGGRIEVESKPAMGTTFRIFFPAFPNAEITERSPKLQPTQPGTETILLVEDDETILEMAGTFLRSIGYQVTSCSSPFDAIHRVQHEGFEPHLLLSDVIMPGLTGPELASEIRKMLPDCKILLMSGYTGDIIAKHGVLNQEIGFLQKPFRVFELADKVRTVLNS